MSKLNFYLIAIMFFSCGSARQYLVYNTIKLDFLAITKLQNGQSQKFESSQKIIDFKNTHIVLTPLIKDFSYTRKEGDSLKTLKSLIDTGYIAFIYKKKDLTGFSYRLDGNDWIKLEKIDIDNFEAENTFKPNQFDFLNSVLTDPIKIINFRDGIRKEIYTPLKKVESDADTIILEYNDKLRQQSFSYSNQLDNRRKSKLVSISMIFNNPVNGSRSTVNYNLSIPKENHFNLYERLINLFNSDVKN